VNSSIASARSQTHNITCNQQAAATISLRKIFKLRGKNSIINIYSEANHLPEYLTLSQGAFFVSSKK